MKEKKKRKLPIFRFNLLAVFVDPLLRARLRARLLHARENAHTSAVFSLFPPLSPSPCPSSVSSLLLSSLLSLSLWPSWSSGSSYRVAARIVTHKLLSIVGDPRACMLLHSTGTRAAFFRGDSGWVCVYRRSYRPGFFPFPPSFRVTVIVTPCTRTSSSEERNIDIYRVVCNLTARMKGLFFRGGNERLIVRGRLFCYYVRYR